MFPALEFSQYKDALIALYVLATIFVFFASFWATVKGLAWLQKLLLRMKGF